jgi:hypothetical protein
MRNWIKTLLFLSAFSPILFSLAYVRYDIGGLSLEVFYLIISGLVGVGITAIIIRSINRYGEALAFSAKKIESNDVMLIAFIFSYLAPFIIRAAEINLKNGLIVTLVIILVLYFVSSVPSHPLLRLLKFRFYKVESASGVVYTLISKREIRDPRDVKVVKQISSSMLMEVV